MTNWLETIKTKLTITKPIALQWHEWEEWEAQMRKERPLAYWLNETIPYFFDDIRRSITKPFKDLRYWIRYRTFDKYHVIPTGLEPGYYDSDTRLLHGMFQLLVDFVEIEKAWMHVVWSDDNRRAFRVPWYSRSWFRIKNWRSREAGLAYLDWECTLGSPTLANDERCDSQAATAYEIIDLYKWWTEVRQNRPDPHDASGWTEYCRQREAIGYNIMDTRHETPQDDLECRRILDLTQKIEQEQETEDTNNLVRLIKLRRSLWT